MAIKCAIIGCGQIAGGYDNPSETHLIRTHAKAIQKNPRTELIAVCDTNHEIAKSFASRWGALRSYTDVKSLFKEEEIDLLSICSPTKTHFQILKQGLSAKIPCIWLEKPATNSLEQLEELIQLSKGTSSQVHLNYFRRYDQGFQRAKDIIRKDKVLSVTAHYTKGLHHNGSHLLNLLFWWFGNFKNFHSGQILHDSHFPAVSGTLELTQASVDLKAYDYNLFEIFELDIILQGSRIRVIDGGQKIEFYTVQESPYYSAYHNFQLASVHQGTYGRFMEAGLKSVLAGDIFSSLEDELALNEAIVRIEEQVGAINE